jgi:hypothetical protein
MLPRNATPRLSSGGGIYPDPVGTPPSFSVFDPSFSLFSVPSVFSVNSVLAFFFCEARP